MQPGRRGSFFLDAQSSLLLRRAMGQLPLPRELVHRQRLRRAEAGDTAGRGGLWEFDPTRAVLVGRPVGVRGFKDVLSGVEQGVGGSVIVAGDAHLDLLQGPKRLDDSLDAHPGAVWRWRPIASAAMTTLRCASIASRVW